MGTALLLAGLAPGLTSAQPGRPPEAVTSGAPDIARLAAARTLVQLLGTEQQIRAQAALGDASATFDRLVPSQVVLRQQLTDPAGYAKAREQAIGILTEGRNQIAATTIPLVIDADARRYAVHFSLAELRQLIAFYQSPLGQRLIAEQPGMAADASRFQATVLQPIANAQNAATGQRLAPVLAPILRQAASPSVSVPVRK